MCNGASPRHENAGWLSPLILHKTKPVFFILVLNLPVQACTSGTKNAMFDMSQAMASYGTDLSQFSLPWLNLVLNHRSLPRTLREASKWCYESLPSVLALSTASLGSVT